MCTSVRLPCGGSYGCATTTRLPASASGFSATQQACSWYKSRVLQRLHPGILSSQLLPLAHQSLSQSTFACLLTMLSLRDLYLYGFCRVFTTEEPFSGTPPPLPTAGASTPCNPPVPNHPLPRESHGLPRVLHPIGDLGQMLNQIGRINLWAKTLP